MIFLQREKAEFTKTKEEFGGAYRYLLESMFDTFKNKGKIRDVHTPVHHRMSPATMLALAQAKMRRVEALFSEENWEGNETIRIMIMAECTDIANYALFLGALCLMLQKEAEE